MKTRTLSDRLFWILFTVAAFAVIILALAIRSLGGLPT